MTQHPAILATQNWLKNFVIAQNICPFARKEFENNRIRYIVVNKNPPEETLIQIISECIYLNNHPETETSLLIFPDSLSDFDDYLEFLDLAEQLLIKQGYEGIYQLASFHPDYCFANSLPDDAANFTNRSPYPTIHLLREASIERAIQQHPAPKNIPGRNILHCRRQGAQLLQTLLANCLTTTTLRN